MFSFQFPFSIVSEKHKNVYTRSGLLLFLATQCAVAVANQCEVGRCYVTLEMGRSQGGI